VSTTYSIFDTCIATFFVRIFTVQSSATTIICSSHRNGSVPYPQCAPFIWSALHSTLWPRLQSSLWHSSGSVYTVHSHLSQLLKAESLAGVTEGTTGSTSETRAGDDRGLGGFQGFRSSIVLSKRT